MPNSTKKIVFITHDATLTGAPILLLRLLQLLKETNKYHVYVIIKNGAGALIHDFEQLSNEDVLIWKHVSTNAPSLVERVKNKIFKPQRFVGNNDTIIQEWIAAADYIFSNTITNGDILEAFAKGPQTKVISYIHELEIACSFYTTPHFLQKVLTLSNFFLVPSKAVGEHLTKNFQVPAKKIEILNYYIPFDATNKMELPALSLPPSFYIGISGTLDWRKGADIITVVVLTFFKKYPNATVTFLWKGANTEGIEYTRIIYELKKLKLTDKIIFQVADKNMSAFYQAIDIFLLLSKEDPYPLVVLEAASFNKPCICFEKAGGAPEFVEDDAGSIVPYLDIENLADTLYTYYANKTMAIEKGKVAGAKYKKLHQNKELILAQLEKGLQIVTT